MTARSGELAAAVARASADIEEDRILEALRVLTGRLSPPGGERALAVDVAEWGRRAVPDAAWDVDALDGRSANLVARASGGAEAPELALYGHLDTSLTGWPDRDSGVTGLATPPPPLRVDGTARTVSGFGVGVAKAPSAAGIVAFAAACRALRALGVPHRLTLLLAAGGTHRAVPDDDGARFGRGVEHALAGSWRPDAVLNVKAGPRGVLYEEPAAAYLRISVRGKWDAALARRAVAPDGGLARHAGVVLDAIEAWRTVWLASHPGSGQLAPEIAIGAVRSGLPEKPDLLPGLLEVFVYAVLLPGEDPERVAGDLRTFLVPRLAGLPRLREVAVSVYASAPGGVASEREPIVRLAREAWTRAFGDTPSVRDWTGATDGAIFLARGIPTARMGPRVTRADDDPRIEIVSLDDLDAAARAYAETAIRFFAGGAA